MDYSTIIPEIAGILFGGAASAYISIKVTQTAMDEKMKAMKEAQETHKKENSDDLAALKASITETMNGCRINHKDRLDGIAEYIKRLDNNKADRSEMKLVVDAMSRVEQKIDLLILRNSDPR